MSFAQMEDCRVSLSNSRHTADSLNHIVKTVLKKKVVTPQFISNNRIGYTCLMYLLEYWDYCSVKKEGSQVKAKKHIEDIIKYCDIIIRFERGDGSELYGEVRTSGANILKGNHFYKESP